ncbi:MAG TPA: ANTAR domain-containing protein [Acetobacteraceae bacterium]|nr:ANTAR domain-containing protein [Acetobacteraceae bacterium]
MKILLADDDAERVRLLIQALAADCSITVLRLPPGESLLDAVAAQGPDVVLVDMARPDRDGLESLRQLSASDPRPIALFVDQDDPSFMEAAIAAGVSSYNVIGTPPPDVKPILRAAVALFRRHQQTRAALDSAETRLQERSIIAQAKTRLMKHRRMSEPDAYRWLRRSAMSSGQRIVDVARKLLHEAGEDTRP